MMLPQSGICPSFAWSASLLALQTKMGWTALVGISCRNPVLIRPCSAFAWSKNNLTAIARTGCRLWRSLRSEGVGKMVGSAGSKHAVPSSREPRRKDWNFDPRSQVRGQRPQLEVLRHHRSIRLQASKKPWPRGPSIPDVGKRASTCPEPAASPRGRGGKRGHRCRRRGIATPWRDRCGPPTAACGCR